MVSFTFFSSSPAPRTLCWGVVDASVPGRSVGGTWSLKMGGLKLGNTCDGWRWNGKAGMMVWWSIRALLLCGLGKGWQRTLSKTWWCWS